MIRIEFRSIQMWDDSNNNCCHLAGWADADDQLVAGELICTCIMGRGERRRDLNCLVLPVRVESSCRDEI